MLEMYRTRFIWMSPAKPSYVMPMSVNINAAAFVHFFCLNIWRKKTFIEFWIWQQWQFNLFYSTFCVSALFQSTSRSEIPSATFNELRIYGFLLIHFFPKLVLWSEKNVIEYYTNVTNFKRLNTFISTILTVTHVRGIQSAFNYRLNLTMFMTPFFSSAKVTTVSFTATTCYTHNKNTRMLHFICEIVQ